MSESELRRPWTHNLEEVRVEGSFDTNGASSPVALKGRGFTVARTGTGTYLITLSRAYAELVKLHTQLAREDYAGSKYALPGPVSNVGTSSPVTLEIKTFDNGVAADLAAAQGSRVQFELVLRLTTVA